MEYSTAASPPDGVVVSTFRFSNDDLGVIGFDIDWLTAFRRSSPVLKDVGRERGWDADRFSCWANLHGFIFT